MLKKNSNVLISILVLLLYFIWPYFINVLLSGIFGLKGTGLLALTLVMNFALLFIVIYIYRDSLKRELTTFKKGLPKVLGTGLIVFLIGFGLYGVFNSLICELFPSISNVNYDAMSKMFTKTPLLLFISTIFYYPVIEELVFKKTFRGIINNKWLFIVFTGLLNALFEVLLANGGSGIELVFLIPISLFYMSFSYMYYKTDSVVTPIVYRMLYNIVPTFCNVVLSVIMICF